MTAPEFLEFCKSRGLVVFESDGGSVKIVGSRPALDDMKKLSPPNERELRDLIQAPSYRMWLTVERMKKTNPGWSIMRSINLNCPIVIVRDAEVKIPAEVCKYAVYTLDELELQRTASKEAISVIHKAKLLIPSQLVRFDGMVQ